MWEVTCLREIEVEHELHCWERSETVVVWLLVMWVVEWQGTLRDLGQSLEAHWFVWNVSHNHLAGIDLIYEEFRHLSVCLSVLKISVDKKHVLVNISISFLNLFQEDNHIWSCLYLDASSFTRSEAVALLLEREIQEAEGQSSLIKTVEGQSEVAGKDILV